MDVCIGTGLKDMHDLLWKLGKVRINRPAKDDVIKAYALNKLRNVANEKFLELKDGKIAFQKDFKMPAKFHQVFQ